MQTEKETALGVLSAGTLGPLHDEALEAWYGIAAERYPELDPHERVAGGRRP